MRDQKPTSHSEWHLGAETRPHDPPLSRRDPAQSARPKAARLLRCVEWRVGD